MERTKLIQQQFSRMKKHQFFRAILKKILFPKTKIIMFGSAIFQNPYQTLLYSKLASKSYHLYPVTIDKVIRAQRLHLSDTLHIHWEEFFLRYKTPSDAIQAKNVLGSFTKNGGKIILTIHNELPHDIPTEEKEAFQNDRKFICDLAKKIHVHNKYARDYLLNTFNIPAAKVVVIHHPSYIGWYDDIVKKSHISTWQSNKSFLIFGNLRAYKGFGLIQNGFSLTQKKSAIKKIHVAGNGSEKIKLNNIDGIPLQLTSGYVKDEQVPHIFLDSDYAVFGFSSILTSGSTMLALTFGIPPIAPAHQGVITSLPEELHEFLYKPNDPQDLARVIEHALSLDEKEYFQKRKVCQKYAFENRPSVISEQLIAQLFCN